MENVPLFKTSLGKDHYGRTILSDSIDDDSLSRQDVLAPVVQTQGTERTNANLYAAICAGEDPGGMPLDPTSVYDRGHELNLSSESFDKDFESLPLHTFRIPPSGLLSAHSDAFRSFASGLSAADSSRSASVEASADSRLESEMSQHTEHPE